MDGDETTIVSSLPRSSNPPLVVPDTIPSNPPKVERWRLYRNPQAQERADTYPSGNKREETWEEKFQLLVEYKNEHGTTRVPKSHPVLGGWVLRQRHLHKENKLLRYCYQQLDSIDFEWADGEYDHTAWDKKFQLLLEYKKEYGTTRVHRRHPALSLWVKEQRRHYKRSILPQYRRERLNSIGFEWSIFVRIPWMEMYNQLLCYKMQHNGSTKVARTSEANKRLGLWINNQRALYFKNKLSQQRIDLMESIGFKWDPYHEQWMEMYQRLVAFNKKYGTTCVPQGCKIDPQLGVWVNRQRTRCKEQYRIDLLNSINFVWDASRSQGRGGRMQIE